MPDADAATEPTVPNHAIVPNHHAHHPGFAGLTGLVAALTFSVGRRGFAELAIGLVDLQPGDRVVDVGCGPGVAARVAAGQGASVIGVDPAPVMLDVARWSTWRRTSIEWAAGTAERLPVPTGAADVVWSLSTVHHWADVSAGLAEVGRVLAPGGRFIAVERRVDPTADGNASHGWSPNQADAFADACRTAGLGPALVSSHDTDRGEALAVVARQSP